jgi:putative hydrolase of the HAD superfamily
VRAVTFDATGTLIHAPRLGEIYSEVLARHGYDVAPAAAHALVTELWRQASLSVLHGEDRFAAHPGGARGWWGDFLGHLCARLEGPPPSRFAAAELYERFSRAEAWELYPDVRPTLATLGRRGLRLAVIANWDERLPGLLAELGLAGCFETIVTSQGAGVEKPHPLIFQTALGLLGLAPEAVLHVGDRRLEDLEGAEALGMPAVLLARDGGGPGIGSLAALGDEPRLQASC